MKKYTTQTLQLPLLYSILFGSFLFPFSGFAQTTHNIHYGIELRPWDWTHRADKGWNIFTGTFKGVGNDFFLQKRRDDGSSYWLKTYAGAGDQSYSIALDDDDQIAVCGKTLQPSFSYWDGFIAVMDTNGLPLWSRGYGSALEDEYFNDIIYHAPSSSYIAVGYLGPNNQEDLYIVSVNKNTGFTNWSRVFTEVGSQKGISMTVTDNGSIAVAGTSLDGAVAHLTVIILSPSGNVLHYKRIGGVTSIEPGDIDSDGNQLFIAGHLYNGIGAGGMFVSRLDSMANYQYTNTFDLASGYVMTAEDIHVLPTGDFLVVGMSVYDNAYMMKGTYTNVPLFYREYDGDTLLGVSTVPSGEILVGGYDVEPVGFYAEWSSVALRTLDDGTLPNACYNSEVLDSNFVNLVAGSWVDTTQTQDSSYIFTITPATITAIVDTICGGITNRMDPFINSGFTISPVPASEILQVQWNTELNGAMMQLFDVTGELILETSLDGGSKTLDVSQLRNGVYFVVVKTSMGLGTRKVVVVH